MVYRYLSFGCDFSQVGGILPVDELILILTNVPLQRFWVHNLCAQRTRSDAGIPLEQWGSIQPHHLCFCHWVGSRAPDSTSSERIIRKESIVSHF